MHNENSNDIMPYSYEPASKEPTERLNEIRGVLQYFPDNCSMLFIQLFPFEFSKLPTEFPEFNFTVLKKVDTTIFCRISRNLN